MVRYLLRKKKSLVKYKMRLKLLVGERSVCHLISGYPLNSGNENSAVPCSSGGLPCGSFPCPVVGWMVAPGRYVFVLIPGTCEYYHVCKRSDLVEDLEELVLDYPAGP